MRGPRGSSDIVWSHSTVEDMALPRFGRLPRRGGVRVGSERRDREAKRRLSRCVECGFLRGTLSPCRATPVLRHPSSIVFVFSIAASVANGSGFSDFRGWGQSLPDRATQPPKPSAGHVRTGARKGKRFNLTKHPASSRHNKPARLGSVTAAKSCCIYIHSGIALEAPLQSDAVLYP